MLEHQDFIGKYEESLEEIELSINTYSLPLRIEDLVGIYGPRFSPEHIGEFAPAIDFAVADPRVRETEVLAPCDGVVFAGRLANTRWGEGREFVKFLNWINIRTDNNEFFELAHIAPIARRILRVGDRVKRGEVIAVAGLNGRMTMTDGKVDSHVHMLVGREKPNGFTGLRIRWVDL